jgi:hypothetical protein
MIQAGPTGGCRFAKDRDDCQFSRMRSADRDTRMRSACSPPSQQSVEHFDASTFEHHFQRRLQAAQWIARVECDIKDDGIRPPLKDERGLHTFWRTATPFCSARHQPFLITLQKCATPFTSSKTRHR